MPSIWKDSQFFHLMGRLEAFFRNYCGLQKYFSHEWDEHKCLGPTVSLPRTKWGHQSFTSGHRPDKTTRQGGQRRHRQSMTSGLTGQWGRQKANSNYRGYLWVWELSTLTEVDLWIIWTSEPGYIGFVFLESLSPNLEFVWHVQIHLFGQKIIQRLMVLREIMFFTLDFWGATQSLS